MLSSSTNQQFQIGFNEVPGRLVFSPNNQEAISPKANAIEMVDTPDARKNPNTDYYGNYANSTKNS